VGKFRFGLQALLDERVREEQRAHALFLLAESEHERVRREAREIDEALLACDPSAFVVTDVLEQTSFVRRRDVEEKYRARERARIVFERERLARMQLTIVRERAYGAFLEEEERDEARELDEANGVLYLIRDRCS
jgi:hypothetical protein